MKLIAFCLALLLPVLVLAQPKTIKGRIVDAASQEGIAYASIGIEGTHYGTASDDDGFFDLKIPDGFLEGKLFVSAIGYHQLTLTISELLGTEFARVPLQEQTYRIEGIDVHAQSRVLFRIVRTAARQIPQNYLPGPLGIAFYYQEDTRSADSSLFNREAIVELFDKSGYSNPSITDAYQNRNYRFTQVRKDFESRSFLTGQTGFDELLEMDPVRLSNTIMNEELLNDYDLSLEASSVFEGDSVWIISYRTTEPGLAYSGDYYATQMEGRIYILMKNYAVIRNECQLEASKNNSQNRSLFTGTNEQQQVNYHYTSIYKEANGKYALSYLDCDKSWFNPEGKKITLSRRASVLDLQLNPVEIKGRDYFENTPYVESFWNSFTRP